MGALGGGGEAPRVSQGNRFTGGSNRPPAPLWGPVDLVVADDCRVLIRLLELATDGTRVKANNSRHRTATTAGASGFIVDEEVLAGAAEAATVIPMLDRGAFAYNEQADRHHCPTGQRLTYGKTTSKRNACGSVAIRAYRMNKAESKELYKRRMWTGETPFAYIKAAMGVRQFLLRGLPNVQTEWRWVCTAFNLGKLARELTRLRAEFALAAA